MIEKHEGPSGEVNRLADGGSIMEDSEPNVNDLVVGLMVDNPPSLGLLTAFSRNRPWNLHSWRLCV